MKYRKKPVVIEAAQYLGFSKENGQVMFDEKPEWLVNKFGKEILFFGVTNTLSIRTLEGDMFASIGDFIILGVSGEVYPCKPDIFAKTYEKVDE